MRRFRFCLFLLLVSPLLLGCNADASNDAASDTSLREVDLALNWLPEAEHGGFFAAAIGGHFEQEGLKVNIIPGGPGVPVVHNVATGRAAFGVANADQVLLGRAKEAKVKAVFAAMQHSPRCILVHEDSQVKTFEDLKDITLAVGVGKSFAEYMQVKLPLENVTIVPFTGGTAQFLRDKNFAQQGYVFSEPFVAQQQGAKVRCLMLSDLGFDPYASVLIAQDETIEKEPELVGRMVRACVKGWRDYLANPQPVNEHIHEINPEMEMDALAFGAKEIRKLCLPEGMDAEQLGAMTPERWRTLADQMIEAELLTPEEAQPEEAFLW